MEEDFEWQETVELIAVEGLMEAEIIKAQLDSFEIPCMLKFEALGRVFGITTDGLGKVQVMVPIGYLDKAREIIEAENEPPTDENDNHI